MRSRINKRSRIFGLFAGILSIGAGVLMVVAAAIARHPLHFQSESSQTLFWVFGQPLHYLLPGIVLILLGILLIMLLRRPVETAR